MFNPISTLIFIIPIHQISCIIYQLNETEYARMPPLHLMDPYESCMEDPDGFYCTAELTLTSDKLSPLLNMIQEYSEHTVKHFNHSKLTYGVCMNRSCRKHWNGSEHDPKRSYEACINEIIFKNYSLNVKLNGNPFCHKINEPVSFNTSDKVVASICIMVLAVNLAASFFDIFFKQKSQVSINIQCFSMQRNWKRLLEPTSNGRDDRCERLVSLNGLKTVTSIFIVGFHSIIPLVIFIGNPQFHEATYENLLFRMIYNGTILAQIYFIASGLMLIYNMQITAEKADTTWKFTLKAITLRWLRLTPTYALAVALTSTLIRFAGQGPTWQLFINTEAESCGQEWLWHMLYMNNYLKHTRCMAHTWQLGADMVLSILGIIFFVFFRKNYRRNIALGILLVIGVISPALHTYFQDLDGAMLPTPENIRTLFRWYPTFYSVYKTVHNNLACYVLGLALGYYIYQKQTDNIDIRFKNIRFIVWSMLPLILIIVMIPNVFYDDGPRASVYIRTLYAGLSRPVYGLFASVIIIGMVFKCEDMYRAVLEWQGWTVPAKLSYGALVWHPLLVKIYFGSQTTALDISYYKIVVVFVTFVAVSYIVAIPVYLLVEAPTTQLAKLYVDLKGHKSSPKNILKSEDINNATANKPKQKVL